MLHRHSNNWPLHYSVGPYETSIYLQKRFHKNFSSVILWVIPKLQIVAQLFIVHVVTFHCVQYLLHANVVYKRKSRQELNLLILFQQALDTMLV